MDETEYNKRALLEEFYRRQVVQSAAQATVARIRKELFDKQLALWDDPSVNKAAICTRRAGKTSLWARYCTATALLNPRGLIRIWGINRLRTKQLLWQEEAQMEGWAQPAEYITLEREYGAAMNLTKKIRMGGGK